MAKKKDVGNVVSIDLPADPVKPKRVISEQQRNNLKKGMAALKAKREGLRKEQEDDASDVVEPVVAPAPAPVPIHEVKAKRVYTKQPKKESVGIEEFNNFKNELLGRLQPKEVIKEVSVEKIVDRPVVTEKVVEREKFLSGSELINRIFFN
tara:strand:- start:176 stop:628 length:453 start_codon:yes stop_codon:yes gene_type:complete